MSIPSFKPLRALCFLLGVLAFIATAQAQKRPVVPEDYVSLKSAGSAEVSPDGRWVVYTLRAWNPDPLAKDKKEPNGEADKEEGKDKDKDKSGKKKYKNETHLWLLSTDPASGVEPRQLTFGEKDEGGPQWSPDGKFISFTTTRSKGAESKEPRSQIWLLPMNGGEPQPLTEAKEGVSGYKWSPDGSRIVYLSQDPLSKEEKEKKDLGDDAENFEKEPPRYTHIWIFDVKAKKATQITQGKDFIVNGAPNWSADGKRLAFTGRYTGMARDERKDAYIVDIDTKAVRKITANSLAESAPQFSPDGRTLAFTALPQHARTYDHDYPDRGIHQSRLMLYDLQTGQVKDVSSPSFDQAVSLIEDAWTPNGRQIWFTSSTGAYTDVFSYDLAANRYKRMTTNFAAYPSGPSFTRDRSRVVFSKDSNAEPSNIYIAKGDFTGVKRLSNINPQMEQWGLGESEVIQWKSNDGWVVEGILLKPVGYQKGMRYPLLVDVHGGPTGSHKDNFKNDGQFWAGKGWAVLYPNPRGSTGYGEKFMRGNIPDWGGGDYRDIMTGVDALIERGVADKDKLAVMGWSYGGYMTAWIVSQTGRFKAAMMGAGLSNIPSMFGTTDIPGYIASFYEGYPNKETMALYQERSGITYVDNITTPLLILHGKDDYRVPLGQATEYYRALKNRNKPVELVIYPREGHGLGEYYHQIDRYYRQYKFIAKYTLGEE